MKRAVIELTVTFPNDATNEELDALVDELTESVRDMGWEPFARNAGWSLVPVPPVLEPGRELDPFSGSGTTLAVAQALGRDAIGIDLDESNADLCRERVGLFLQVDEGGPMRSVVDVVTRQEAL